MKQVLINEAVTEMLPYLNNSQAEKLKSVLSSVLFKYDITVDCENVQQDETDYLDMFLSAKRIEGCSEKTLNYYRATILTMLNGLKKDVKQVTTEEIRQYLTDYQARKQSSKVTIDNIRRILSSFFSWLEDEDYIMIDLLASTGMRVGEMVLLNREDINFNERECVVFGKGNKERMVYFDARTKIHLQNYLNSRDDSEPALFVSLKSPHYRLKINGVEKRLRNLGQQLGINKVHPHKFRRTLATLAIDKGMPIEQLQQLLGHKRIDTTLQYAMVKQSNVKIAHRKYLS